MTKHSFIFIGGLHRSGTSLIHQILRTHSDISGFTNTGAPEDEGQHLQSIFPAAKAFGGPGHFARASDSHMDELHPLATKDNALALMDEWSRHWDLKKTWLIEKSPPNIVRTRFLQEIFPRSHFITLFRHPIAIAMATRKWTNSSIADLVEHCLIAYERYLDDAEALHNRRVVRYEDLISNPSGTIDDLLRWLGIKSFTFTNEVRSELNTQYFSQWDALPHQEKSNIIERFEVRTNRIGYSLANLK